MSKCNCSSQKPLLATRILTRDLWFRSLDLRPLAGRLLIGGMPMDPAVGDISFLGKRIEIYPIR
jgi:hypothetical protein